MVRACRICKGEIEPFMSFGQMPNANGFLREEQVSDEPFYELAPAFCDSCKMFQLMEQPDPTQMFNENYAYYSGTSKFMKRHFSEFAQACRAKWMDGRNDPLIVEIGSNDGIMLRNFRDWGMRHLGVEPSRNVAEVAIEQGVETIVAFFSTETAARVRAEHGPAQVIFAANVMSHIATLPDIAVGVSALLDDDGVLIIESPYLGAVIEKGSYDQLYDEHVYMFSALSVANAFAPHGLTLIDVEALEVHGGSLRWTLGKSGVHARSAAVEETFAAERDLGLDKPETFEAFRRRCETSRDDLVALLKRLKSEGARIVGYGATAKSATVLNYCRIGPELIEFISDTTAIKQGKLSPGMHIPVKPHAAFAADYPEYAVLFAWNHAEEIMQKEGDFAEAGGKWIRFVPEVTVGG